MSVSNDANVDDSEAEIFVPGRLCILGEHTDWAAEYRVENPSISYGTLLLRITYQYRS